jgi:hypothetical protein
MSLKLYIITSTLAQITYFIKILLFVTSARVGVIMYNFSDDQMFCIIFSLSLVFP